MQLSSTIVQKLKLNVFLQAICSLNKNLFATEVKKIFANIESNLKELAVEINADDEKTGLINKMACQFYAAFLNKLENGFNFFWLKI